MRLTKNIMLRFCSVVLVLAAPLGVRGDDQKLADKIDKVMNEVYKPGEPGAAIIVRRHGKTLFRKGYGMANLELGVEVEPDMVFRIGSLTKQFTAAAILMLAEQGKLALQDEIGKYIPDFPTGGKKVTIEHLLSHASGIRSYTEMDEWPPLRRKDMTPREIIAMSKDKPFEFEPGERHSCNNTGYVMLGAVIERVSGKSYEDFVRENIFVPLGMNDSGYDRTEKIIPRRVAGYHKNASCFVNAPYLISMTQPHAAGSLCSTVDDLALWNNAVLSGRLLKQESLKRAFTPFKTCNGNSTGCGCGWYVGRLGGSRTMEHGGGFFGFTSYALALPDDGACVIILANCVGEGRAPELRAVRIAELVLGLEPEKRKPVVLAGEELEALVGAYANEAGDVHYLIREGNRLFFQAAGGATRLIQAASAPEFFFTDAPIMIRIMRAAGGSVSGLSVAARYGPVEAYKRSGKPLPDSRKEIALDPALLDRLAGEYEFQPGLAIVVTIEEGRLMGQATGQEKVELFPESETGFFLKVVDAQVVFAVNANGRVSGLTLIQGGQKLSMKKIK